MSMVWRSEEERKAFEQADLEASVRAHEVTVQDERDRQERLRKEREHDKLVQDANQRIRALEMRRDRASDGHRRHMQAVEYAEGAVEQVRWNFNRQLENDGYAIAAMIRRRDGADSGGALSALSAIAARFQDDFRSDINRGMNRLVEDTDELESAHKQHVMAIEDEEEECHAKVQKAS